MLLLTSLTGSILFLVWYGVARIMEKSGYLNIVFYVLEGIQIFWFLPISYCWLIVKSRKRWGYILFSTMKGFDIWSKIILQLWILGVLLMVCNLLIRYTSMKLQKKKCFPVDGEVYDWFCKICKEMEIEPSKIELLYDYKASTPYISGYLKKYIVLPCREYTQEQLEIILLHELTHSKQKSMCLRYVTEFSVSIHFFNPVIWFYRSRLHYWEEYMCDYEIINKMGNPDYYFHVIEEIANHKFGENILGLGLAKEDIKNRRNMMKRSYKMKRSRKILIASMAFMIMVSTSMVAGATEMIGNGYFKAYLEMVDENSSVEEQVEDVEYILDEIEEGVVVHQDMEDGISMLGTMTNLDWHINGNEAMESSVFSVTNGQEILVSAVIEPSDAVVRVGIKQSNGTIRYVLVNGTGGTYHRFAISQSGDYRIYIQNMSSNAIDVNVSYRVE